MNGAGTDADAATMLLTVAIPTRNRCDLLLRAVRSVPVGGPPGGWEILVSDNASIDDTQAVMEREQMGDPRIRFHRQAADVGMVGNWNWCVQAARGRWLLLLSDDDEVEPGFLTGLLPALAALDARARVAFTGCRIAAAGRLRPAYKDPLVTRGPAGFLARVLLRRYFPQLCATVFHRRHLLDAGGFDPSLRFAVDVAAWVRAVDASPVVPAIPSAVAIYHPHAGGATAGLAIAERLEEDGLVSRRMAGSLVRHGCPRWLAALMVRFRAVLQARSQRRGG